MTGKPVDLAPAGKGLSECRQRFRQKDIPVAGITKPCRQLLPKRIEAGNKGLWQQRLPEADRRPQATDGNPRLMNELRLLTLTNALFVALQVVETGQGNQAKGLDGRHAGRGDDRQRLGRGERHIGQQSVGTFRLAACLRVQRQAGLQLDRHIEQIADLAGEQFQFDLPDGLALTPRIDPAAVERQFDAHTLARLQQPDIAPEVRGEYGLQMVTQRFEQFADDRVIHMRKVELSRPAGNLPLAALRQSCGEHRGCLDGEQTLPPFLAVTHDDPFAPQSLVRRVVVGIDQQLPLRLDAAQDGLLGQLARGTR